MKYINITLGKPIQMPVQVLGSRWLGLQLLIKPSSAQSKVFGRGEYWVWRWKVKQ